MAHEGFAERDSYGYDVVRRLGESGVRGVGEDVSTVTHAVDNAARCRGGDRSDCDR